MTDTDVFVLVASLEARIASLESQRDSFKVSLDSQWVSLCSVLIVLMQVGFAMVESGSVQEKSVISTYAKNVLDFVVGIFVACFFGYDIAYPRDDFFIQRDHTQNMSLLFFSYVVFQATAATIVSGSMAERTSILGYLIFSAFLSGFIYPIAVRMSWGGGYLAHLDPPFHDFAGSGVVHLVGGVASLVGAIVVGPRTGRFHGNNVLAREFEPHSVPSVIIGSFFLWLGWYGFNAGSSQGLSTLENAQVVSTACLSTSCSACAATMFTLLWGLFTSKFRTFNVVSLASSLVGGLVAITAGCDFIGPVQAMIIGFIAGAVQCFTSFLRQWLCIDDVIDAFAVHGACGLWGLLAVAIFHEEKSGLQQLKSQVIGTALLIVVSLVGSVSVLVPLRCLGVLRISLDAEVIGLDAKLGISAYNSGSKWLQHYRSLAASLHSVNQTPHDACEALRALRDIIYRPLTAQASENKLLGEVQDILDNLTNDDSTTDAEFLCFISHHKADAGEVARVFTNVARTLLLREHSPESPINPSALGFGCQSEISMMRLRSRSSRRIAPERLVFFDSDNLTNLSTLLKTVASTQNFVLLLTKHVLERPWCLAEIIAAHKANIKTFLVKIEWPKQDKDSRSFMYADDLECAIYRWETYCALNSSASNHMPIRISQLGEKMRRTSSIPTSASAVSTEESLN